MLKRLLLLLYLICYAGTTLVASAERATSVAASLAHARVADMHVEEAPQPPLLFPKFREAQKKVLKLEHLIVEVFRHPPETSSSHLWLPSIFILSRPANTRRPARSPPLD